jgi:site-specific recombinase XerD
MRSRSADPDQGFWTLARSFLRDHCPWVRRMSPKTIEAYRIGLECYISYLSQARGVKRQDVGFGRLDLEHVKGYAAWMAQTRSYAPKTIELRLTVIKSFLRYAAGEDITLMALHQAARQVKPPKQPKKPVEHLTRAATAAILAAPDGATAKARRNRMMLILLYDSAARVSEITGATVGDVRLEGAPFIALTGKGGKTRNMPLMGKTIDHLRVYLDEFHPSRHGGAPLFHSIRQGIPQALSTDSVALILKQAADQARPTCPEVPNRVHCHLLRATRATHLYQDGVPLPLIMQMLGHEHMSTTSAFYAFATQDMMSKAIQTANPHVLGETAQWKEPAIIDALYAL